MKAPSVLVIGVVLAVVALVAVPLSPQGETFSEDGVDYAVVSEGRVEVVGGTASDLRITGSVSHGGVEYEVASIAEGAFSASSDLVSVTMSGVPDIGDGAFQMCMSLREVVLGEGVESIGYAAFGYCPMLGSVSLPSTLTSMQGNPFVMCEGLSSISVDEGNTVFSVHEGALVDDLNGVLVRCPDTGAGSFTVPDTVTSIAEFAFAANGSIVSLTVPDSVTSIGDMAFSDMTALESVSLPGHLEYMGMNAFSGCVSLLSFQVPTVTECGGYVLNGCIALADVTFAEGVSDIPDGMFYHCVSIQGIAFPDSVTRLGGSVLEGCSSLQVVSLPAGLVSVGDRAFSDCPNLLRIEVEAGGRYTSDDGVLIDTETAVLVKYPAGREDTVYSVPSGILRIIESAFEWSDVVAVDLPEGLVAIDDEAFANCSSLEYVELPSTLAVIGDGAFYRCSSLGSIRIPAGTEYIGDEVFTGCSSLQSIDVDNANPGYTSVDGVLYDRDMTLLKQFPGGRSERVYVVPASVTEIGPGALALCSGLMAIDVEEGNRAFSSVGGVLMDALGTTVIVVPSGKVGDYRVPEEVVRFETGALYGCYDVSLVFYTTDVEFEVMSLSVGDAGRTGTLSISAPDGFSVPDYAYDDHTLVLLDTGGEKRDMATIAIGIAVTVFALVTAVAVFWRRP